MGIRSKLGFPGQGAGGAEVGAGQTGVSVQRLAGGRKQGGDDGLAAAAGKGEQGPAILITAGMDAAAAKYAAVAVVVQEGMGSVDIAGRLIGRELLRL
jgi:hypothetical protein